MKLIEIKENELYFIIGNTIVLYDAHVSKRDPNGYETKMMVGKLGLIYGIPKEDLNILHEMVQIIIKKLAEDSGVQKIFNKEDLR